MLRDSQGRRKRTRQRAIGSPIAFRLHHKGEDETRDGDGEHDNSLDARVGSCKRGEETYGDGVEVALLSGSDLHDSDLEVAREGGIATGGSSSLRSDGGGHALGDDLGDAKGDESDNVDSLHLGRVFGETKLGVVKE